MKTEYYRSLLPNTDPNGNGNPALLRVIHHDNDTVQMTVTIEQGSVLAGAGSIFIVSDITVDKKSYEGVKDLVLAQTEAIPTGTTCCEKCHNQKWNCNCIDPEDRSKAIMMVQVEAYMDDFPDAREAVKAMVAEGNFEIVSTEIVDD